METFPRFPSIIHGIPYMEVFPFTASEIQIWQLTSRKRGKSFFEFALESGLFGCAWIQDYGSC